jgi:hypothetical protein
LEDWIVIEVWHDGMITPGPWEQQLMDKLYQSDVIILLLSSSFFDSSYIWDTELPLALQRERDGLCNVIPIVVENCDWQGHGDSEHYKLSELQYYPKMRINNTDQLVPLEEWEHKSKAFHQITTVIRNLD